VTTVREYKGVVPTTDGRFRARIFERDLGVYDSPEEAALVYDLTADATLGKFAEPVLNFPDIQEELSGQATA